MTRPTNARLRYLVEAIDDEVNLPCLEEVTNLGEVSELAKELIELRTEIQKRTAAAPGVDLCECCGRWFDEHASSIAEAALRVSIERMRVVAVGRVNGAGLCCFCDYQEVAPSEPCFEKHEADCPFTAIAPGGV